MVSENVIYFNDYKVPSGTGDRAILCHLGSEQTGLLPGALLFFHGKKAIISDYHTEMNSQLFTDWLKQIVFPKLKQIGHKCVLVLDRATYHTMITSDMRKPTKSWTKKQLSTAIRRWYGPCDDDWPLLWHKLKLKYQLFEEAVKLHPGIYYEVQKLADTFQTPTFNIKILFLPVAHPELNPIEKVWGTVKRAVATKIWIFVFLKL